jgi:hypothetical protein
MKKVYTEADEERFNKILREIQARVPAEWKRRAVVEQPFTPTMKMVFEKALESPTIDEEKKRQIKNILDSGQLSKMVSREDPKITKQIDNFVNREINKAVKEGRLPPKSHSKYLPSMIRIKENEEKKS